MRHKLLERTKTHCPFWQLLGTNLSFTNLLASSMGKDEERVLTRFTSNEATIAVESLALGECRAHLQGTHNQKLVGEGQPQFPLRVDRILYEQKKPFTSIVAANLSNLVTQKEKPADNDEEPTPLLCLKGINDALLQGYFHYNMTLHAYHFLRQSEAISGMVWLHSDVRRQVILKSGMLDTLDPTKLTEMGELAIASEWPPILNLEGVKPPSEEEVEAVKALEETILNSVRTSFGVMITPLAAGNAMDSALRQLQERLLCGVAVFQVSEIEEEVETQQTCPTLYKLLRSDDFHLHSCQNILSILTNDVEKSTMAAEKARQSIQDPLKLAPIVKAIRSELHFDDLPLDKIDLDVEHLSRCGVDFFCRCSPVDFFSSLMSLPEETYKVLYGKPFRCSHCCHLHQVSTKAWEELTLERQKNPELQKETSPIEKPNKTEES